MLVSLQLVGNVVTPPNVTVLAPTVAPKFVPVIVTEVPTGPEVGFKLVMVAVTTKIALLEAPPTVTTMFPVAAPTGTGTLMLVSLQLVGVAVTPLNVTVLLLCVDPKPVPVIVTGVAMGPKLGLKLRMTGPDGVVMLKTLEYGPGLPAASVARTR